MLLPSPNFLADPQELHLLPGKIEVTVPSVSEKITLLLHVRPVELVSVHNKCAPDYFLPKH